ncbi:hypothetical protein JHD49_09365 [Sulfurimonas sp. SAG-AH-194-C21]|nr:hypothetical protein [Sulfurimonas sp. SAG-AH-194-C21]MDF1884147.1 hypothetical protein [Sulfurimonas sp. SAG-AH-194-C21]
MQFFINKEEKNEGCCSVQAKAKLACLGCGDVAKGVLSKTLEHLLVDVSKEKLNCLDGFYYCKTPSCEVIYFRNEETLLQKDIKVLVGLKDGANPATVCYCFEWTKEKILKEIKESGETVALSDIKAKMQNPGCSCETLNPSGGCCLGDVSKAIKEIQNQLN